MGHGIFVYRDVLPKELDIINRLESVLKDPNNQFDWMEAFVGYQESMPEYRDCVDFKFTKKDMAHRPGEASLLLQQLWQDCYDRKSPAVEHYRKIFNIAELRFWEAMNFIRYNKGQHFQYHHDHGFSYNSHRAMPVTSGTKYSIVTMLDYSAKFHGPDMFQETGN